jgi:2-dehydro-3-deoxygalactonokinase
MSPAGSPPTALIGLDWGTTQLRAYRIARDGTLLARRDGGPGIMQVPAGGFRAAFERFVGDWIAASPRVAVLASGMVGSRQGWSEVPYVPCPGGLEQLARGVRRVAASAGPKVYLTPGMSTEGEDGVPDVMRGEETQIAGALGERWDEALVLLPGTHSKWAWVREGAIASFRTFMTGELFAVLSQHSILGRMMDGESDDEPGFERGLGYGLDADGGLLGRLFSARSLALFDRVRPAAVHAYLSGLLIGAEVREALALGAERPQQVVLIGSQALGARYARALTACGIEARLAGVDAAAAGLLAIARAADLVE